MQTTQHPAADLQAAVKKALHSASFTKFMSQAVQTALSEVQGKTAGLVFPAQTKPCRINWSDSHGYRSYMVSNPNRTHTVEMQCGYMPDRPTMRGIWYGNEERIDEKGRRWSLNIGHHVQDDFGNLVEVPA